MTLALTNKHKWQATSEMLEPAPNVTAAEIEGIARNYFGREVVSKFLSSERDCNALLTDPVTSERSLLKLANPSELASVTALQINALLHIAESDPGCPVPRMLQTVDGTYSVIVKLSGGRVYVARMLSFVPGRPMAVGAVNAETAAGTGALLARLNLALKNFDHDADTRNLIWDLSRADDLINLTAHIADEELRQIARNNLDFSGKKLDGILVKLRRQVIHSDFNPHNIIVDEGNGAHVAGVIDFGDIVRAPVVCDIAIAASYMLDGSEAGYGHAIGLIKAYKQTLPLLAEELHVLPGLIAARLAMTVTIPSWRAKLFPENATYIHRNMHRAATALACFDQAAQIQMRDTFLANIN
jgi:hydroxylysine kinase